MFVRTKDNQIIEVENELFNDNGEMKYQYKDSPALIKKSNVVKASNNLNDLIEFVIEINKTTNEICYVYNTTWNFRPSSLCRRIGLIRIGDDLVKVADWDNDKGDWVLYER